MTGSRSTGRLASGHAPLVRTAYSSGYLGLRWVYYMCAKAIDNTSYSSFIIRIFRFRHSTTNCGIYIPSHGPIFREVIMIYKYLLCVYYLWLYSTRINEFLNFCLVCPSPDRFSARKSKMWQRSWEPRSLDLGQSLLTLAFHWAYRACSGG
jgi:hypothetical protein